MTIQTTLAKFSAAVAVGGLVVGAPLGTVSAQEADRSGWPQSIKIGTGSQGGTYFIYGAGWGGLVQEQLGVNASTEVTGGPVQNFALVNAGDLDAGMTTMGPAHGLGAALFLWQRRMASREPLPAEATKAAE